MRQISDGLHEDFKRALSFWNALDVIKTYENLSEVRKSIERLDLVKSEFEK